MCATPSRQPQRPVAKRKKDLVTQGFWKTQKPAILLFLVLSFLLYGLTISFGYVLDDKMVITDNAFTQKGFGGIGDIFSYDSFKGFQQDQEGVLEGGRYRPLSLATFAIETGLFGPNAPGVSHFINIVLYVLTLVLLYRCLFFFFPSSHQAKWYVSLPFIATLLFAVHPLHVEAVANIKGRDEILALLCSLAALIASFFSQYKNEQAWRWLGAVFLLLGILAKENALTFVIIIPLAIWFVHNPGKKRLFQITIPLLVAAAISILMRYNALGYFVGTGEPVTDLLNNPFADMQVSEKYATIMLTLGYYLKLLLVPFPLTADYYPYHIPIVGWGDWRVLLSLLVYIAMTIYAIRNLKSRKWDSFWILYFIITLSIVSNLLVNVGTFMNERFLFMPSVAFCVILGYYISRLVETEDLPAHRTRQIAGTTLAIGCIAVFSLISFLRVPVWKNAIALNHSSVQNSPNSARANLFYATSLREDVYPNVQDPKSKDSLTTAIEFYLNRAIKIHPAYETAWMMKAAVALDRFAIHKDEPRMFSTLDSVMVAIPYHKDFRALIDQYIPFLAAGGGDTTLIHNYAYRHGYEFFYLRQNDLQSAIRLLESALETKAENKRILLALAEVYEKAGNTAKASEMKQRASRPE